MIYDTDICNDCLCVEVCEIAGKYPVDDCEYFKNEAAYEEVRHGEWVTVYSENGYHKECSVCGSRWMLDSKEHVCKETKRCYECGAKMDGRK